MRLGLLGDFHGNAPALEAVLAAVERRGVDALCATGDFVGYYYEPDKVLRLLRERNIYAVRGNHENQFLECLADPSAVEAHRLRFGSGLGIAVRLLSSKDVDYLRGLPDTLNLDFDGKKLLLAHGAPWDTDCYLYQDATSALWERVADTGADYVVLGHTHHKLVKRVGATWVINPGSVGQPRDRLPGASWAVLDTETSWIEHCTETYDIALVAEQARRNDPQLPYLWEVLTRR